MVFFLSLVAQHHGNHKLQDHVGWRILRGEGLGANRNNTHSFDQIDQNMREKHYKAGPGGGPLVTSMIFFQIFIFLTNFIRKFWKKDNKLNKF